MDWSHFRSESWSSSSRCSFMQRQRQDLRDENRLRRSLLNNVATLRTVEKASKTRRSWSTAARSARLSSGEMNDVAARALRRKLLIVSASTRQQHLKRHGATKAVVGSIPPASTAALHSKVRQ